MKVEAAPYVHGELQCPKLVVREGQQAPDMPINEVGIFAGLFAVGRRDYRCRSKIMRARIVRL